MLTTILRISIMYIISILLMRIAGKREVAQLEVGDVVTSFMVAEIACMPLTDPEKPLFDSIVFSATVIALGVFVSYLGIKIPLIKHVTSGKPDFLIVKGELKVETLTKSKVGISELISAMRQNGVTHLSGVDYAIEEPDGTISILAKEDEGSGGLEHMLICDGKINKTEMELFGYNEKKVMRLLKMNGFSEAKDVFYMGVDDEENVRVVGR